MAIDAFLKIDNIRGDSRDVGYEDEFNVLSYSFSASNAVAFTDGGAATGKVSFTDLNFLTYRSRATSLLLQRVASGQAIPHALLTLRRAGAKAGETF